MEQKYSENESGIGSMSQDCSIGEERGGGKRIYCVLGFWASTPSQLSRYQQLYKSINRSSKSCHVVFHTAPVYQFFILPFGMVGMVLEAYRLKNNLENALKKLSKNQSDENSIVFHVLSNNGGLLLMALNWILGKDDRIRKATKGIIFDSCPGVVSLTSLRDAALGNISSKALSNSLLYGPYLSLVMLMAYAAANGQFSLLNKTVQNPFKIFIGHEMLVFLYNDTYMHNISTCFEGVPTLFLYSKKDTLVPPEVIETAISKRKEKQQGSVKVYKFDESEHVAHLKTYPDQYRAEVASFLADIYQINQSFSKI